MTFVTHYAWPPKFPKRPELDHPKESVAIIIGALMIHGRHKDCAPPKSVLVILSLINGNQDQEFDHNELKITP